jgi:hypothetical protein
MSCYSQAPRCARCGSWVRIIRGCHCPATPHLRGQVKQPPTTAAQQLLFTMRRVAVFIKCYLSTRDFLIWLNARSKAAIARTTQRTSKTKGILNVDKRPRNTTKNPVHSAKVNDWRCFLSYCHVCSSNVALPSAASKSKRSHTARENAELQSISKGDESVSCPMTARPSDTSRQMSGNPEFEYL